MPTITGRDGRSRGRGRIDGAIQRFSRPGKSQRAASYASNDQGRCAIAVQVAGPTHFPSGLRWGRERKIRTKRAQARVSDEVASHAAPTAKTTEETDVCDRRAGLHATQQQTQNQPIAVAVSEKIRSLDRSARRRNSPSR